jgi:hypothetical protein
MTMPVRALLVAAACLLAAPAMAQPKAKTKAPAATTAPTRSAPPPPSAGPTGPVSGVAGAAAPTKEGASGVKIERGAGGKKVYKITENIVIEGKIQKPEAFYVLQKSSINYEWQELKQEFLPRILDSVTKAPF